MMRRLISVYVVTLLFLQTVYGSVHAFSEDEKYFAKHKSCAYCNLTRIRVTDKNFLYSIVYSSAFTDASFKDVTLNQVYWVDNDFALSTFERLYIRNSVLSNSNFTGVHMASLFAVEKTDMRNSRFNGASANLSASLAFYEVNLNNTSFIGAKLSKAFITYSNLTHANLARADFSHSNLKNCQFDDANFQGANLEAADLRGSNITQAQLDSTASYRCAVLPDGTVYTHNGEYQCE